MPAEGKVQPIFFGSCSLRVPYVHTYVPHILPHSLATIYQAHDTEHNVILYASVSFSDFLIYDMPKCCNNMYIELLEEEEMHAEGSTTSQSLCTSDCSLMSDK